MRIASSIRNTPSPVVFAVSSAWQNDSATKLMAPRLYTSSGCGHLDRRHQRRQIGEVTGDQLDVRHLLERLPSAFGFDCPFTIPNTS